jgi:serine/threonine protein kinase
MAPPARRPARTLSVDDFLRLILRSGLLSKEQLQTSLKSLPAEQRCQTLPVAEHLVKQGKLSRFQARKLMQGSQRGLVLGAFQILAPIGRGGMGTVYLARDHRSGQLLALKVLPPDRARSEERILERFRREMEMSQKVSHPHLAWTFEYGVRDGIHFLAMEYIPGKSLHRLVADQGPLNVERAARLGREVASALEHLHDQGLVHRDIKPANIMVTPHDHAKLLDLGLALVRGETGGNREVIGGQGYVVGTMDFIAPEQTADPTLVDGRADLYSLGCTLYYALTGQLPFPGGGNKEKMQRQRDEKPRPVLEFNRDVPVAFVDLVERLMAKAPQDRFQSAAEVEEALRPWAERNQVLPLDRPEDLAFLEEVARLEEAEASEDLEIVPPSDAMPASEPPPLVPPPATLSPRPSLWSNPTVRTAVGIFGAGVLVGVALVLLLLWIFRA